MSQDRSCPNCNGGIKLEASFCLHCGIYVSTSADNMCPVCGDNCADTGDFCDRCGQHLTGDKSAMLADVPSVGFFESIKLGFGGCFNFSGRSRRSEFWWWILFSAVVLSIPYVGWFTGLILILPTIAVTTRRLHDTGRPGWRQLWMAIYCTIMAGSAGFAVVLGLFILDSNIILAGVLFSVSALAFVGLSVLMIIWIVWLVKQGDEESNQYGPGPKRTVW